MKMKIVKGTYQEEVKILFNGREIKKPMLVGICFDKHGRLVSLELKRR